MAYGLNESELLAIRRAVEDINDDRRLSDFAGRVVIATLLRILDGYTSFDDFEKKNPKS